MLQIGGVRLLIAELSNMDSSSMLMPLATRGKSVPRRFVHILCTPTVSRRSVSCKEHLQSNPFCKKSRHARQVFGQANHAGLSVRTLWLRFHSIITLDSNLLAGEQGSGQIRLPALRTTVREGREL